MELEADETEDEKLSDSMDTLNQVIISLVTETDISSRSLIHQPEHASWKGFVLALEETANELNMELKEIGKHHNDILPLLKLASVLTSQALSGIVDFSNEEKVR